MPAGWRDVCVGDLADILGGGTPNRSQLDYWRDGTVPWITPTDITANGGKYITNGAESISELGLKNSNAMLVPAKSIVFTTRGTVGNLALAAIPLTCNQSCEIIVPQSEIVDPEFLFYLLDYGYPAFIRLSGGTTFGAITRRDIARVRFAVPADLQEQAVIARILDAVDTALERTREAAARAGDVRWALIQASFEFVGNTEPKKDTSIGQIPQDWDAISGRQAFDVLVGGCSSVDALKLSEAPDAWFMKVDDFNDPANQRLIVRTNIGFRIAENELFRVLPVGTVVIAKRGAAIMKNRVRTTAVPVSLDPNLMALRALKGMRPEFLRLQIEWRNLSRYVENSGVPQLNNKDLYPRYFLRAPDDRQSEIIETIGAAERVEDALIAKCAALEQLKKSLMHDLLTGKVRVRNLSTEAAS